MFRRVPRYTCLTGSRDLRRLFSLAKAPIDVSPEVQDALQHGSAVVALETALVTHGLPRPINLETGLSVERKVRSVGAIPATIGLLDGRVKIGLTKAQLERLADVEGNPGLIKLSRRDLAAAVGLGKSGGTTISATSILASLIGIRVFATGGLGGVHRGGELSWDVSADLTELGRTPIAVVSAGVKSILDIGRTLEYLETQGVAVFTYGASDEFPGFFSPTTGHKSPWRVDSPEAAAKIIGAGQRLGLTSGMLFAAPIPEEHAEAAAFIQDAVDKAIRESEENGMCKHGKAVTPWLLSRVAELTQGKSYPSNIALLENTAIIGGKIAVEYAKLSREYKGQRDIPNSSSRAEKVLEKKDTISAKPTTSSILPPASLLVVGAAAVDVTSQPAKRSLTDPVLAAHSTSPGRVTFSSGGVARNMAEAAHRILSTSSNPDHHAVLLISPLGNDLFAGLLSDDSRKLGLRTDGLILASEQSRRSAVCNLHLSMDGNLTTGVADMSLVDGLSAAPVIEIIEKHTPKIVAFDANLNSEALTSLIHYCNQRQISTFFEPTSVVKSTSILPALDKMIDTTHFHSAAVTFASPNLLELSQLFDEARSSQYELLEKRQWWSVVDEMALGVQYRSDLTLLSRQPISTSNSDTLSFLVNGTAQMAISLLPFFQHLFIKCGDRGVLVAMRVLGEAALSSDWVLERTRLELHQVVAKGKDSILVLKHYPALPIQPGKVQNVTGAGDSFVGTLLAALSNQRNILHSPRTMDELVERAQLAAALSLYSSDAVSPLLSDSIIDNPNVII